MRALLLLCALCVATSLQAADINVDAAPEPACPDQAAGGEAGVDKAIGGPIETTPASARPAAGRSATAPDRSRMSSRWHSLLPGMFR